MEERVSNIPCFKSYTTYELNEFLCLLIKYSN